MFSTFDDRLVKVTPWHTLSKEMRTLLGGEYKLGKLDVSSAFRLFSTLLSEFGGIEPQAEGVHRRIQVAL